MIAQLFRFKGGIKPNSHKDESTTQPIKLAPLPPRLVVPLRQSARAMARCIVEPGQDVLKGQVIAVAEGPLCTAVHAPTSGTVRAIEPQPIPHPSGLPAPSVVIEPDGEERWVERFPFDIATATPQQARDYLRDCGIVGLGGAGFPSHVKLGPGEKGIQTLILNGAECEPWITCDDRLMRERAAQILAGAAMMRHITGARRILVGIEDNKPQAIEAMRQAARELGEKEIGVVAVPTRYPAGGEKQLIRVLTGIEIPYGKLGTHFGVQCFNVGSAHAVYRAIAHGEPLVSRIVTLSGNFERPGNFEVAIGTPIRDLLPLAVPRADTNRYIMGGPMMGVGLQSLDVPVIKATNCVLAGSPTLFPAPPPEMPCIRCGECAKACPAELQPFELYWYSRAKIFGKAQEYSLFDCIECGCCSYVCPSRIPLVDYFRFAKAEIWAREKEKAAADTARERYEFRLAREEREKQEKAAKLAAKTAAGREKAAAALAEAQKPARTPEEEAKHALIAAALERAKAQKEQAHPENVSDLTPEQQAEITAIEARRAEIREQAKPHLRQDD
ncbi:MAG: electron transport complex subunit RsxC [Rhodocyclales bacterium]|nr:electron transport complex subunit RsxC [Rhodocyclales bacterium]